MASAKRPLTREQEYPLIQKMWAGIVDEPEEALTEEQVTTRSLREETGRLAANLYNYIGHVAAGEFNSAERDREKVRLKLLILSYFGFRSPFVDDATISAVNGTLASKRDVFTEEAEVPKLTEKESWIDVKHTTITGLARRMAHAWSETIGEIPRNVVNGQLFIGAKRLNLEALDDPAILDGIDRTFYYLAFYRHEQDAAEGERLDPASLVYKHAAQVALNTDSEI